MDTAKVSSRGHVVTFIIDLGFLTKRVIHAVFHSPVFPVGPLPPPPQYLSGVFVISNTWKEKLTSSDRLSIMVLQDEVVSESCQRDWSEDFEA